MSHLENFTSAYIEAMYFAESGPDDEVSVDTELSPEARASIEADCHSFWRRFGSYIVSEVCDSAFPDSVSQAGHDFYFTRNGHGVGFWEDEWPETYRDILTKGAESYGELQMYLGDDGLAYVA